MDTGLEGKGVVVTGGAGGIGSAVVRAFAAEGSRVAIHYRSSADRARVLADEVSGVLVAADLTNEEEADALVPQALDALGRVDVLVANAGKWPEEDEPMWEMSYDRWKATIAANLDSVYLSCRSFLRHVATTGTGNIVIVSSTAGMFGEAGHADYSSAKAGLIGGLLNSLKNEIVRIAPLGRVNVVCPGWTVTEMARAALVDPSVEPKVTRTMALRKLGKPDDVARVIVSLASDEISGHVTGEVITVAGGMEGRVIHEL